MLTISKVFTFQSTLLPGPGYSLFLCGNKEYPDSFLNKLLTSSFK